MTAGVDRSELGAAEPVEQDWSLSLYCPHGAFKGSCADCAYIAALEAGEPNTVAVAAETGVTDHAPLRNVPAEPERVEVDTWVARPDVGPGSETLLRAGDQVPEALAGFDRRTAQGIIQRSAVEPAPAVVAEPDDEAERIAQAHAQAAEVAAGGKARKRR